MKKFILLLVFLFQYNIFPQPYFQKITTGPVATDVTSSSQCAWGDYNNDGYQDLVVIPWNDQCWPCSYPILIYRNNGDGSFTRDINVIGQQVINGHGAAWGDYDNDGFLDLYVTRYVNQTNMLFHNSGNGTFTQIMTGAIVTDVNSTIGCSWADYNKDGWLDMFVANGQGQNDALYKNNGNGSFTKIMNDPIVLDGADGRACSWGDYNNDGWPDMFVVNYGGEADMLYKNNGNGSFTRIFNGGPLTMDNDWGAGCSWGDYDNDGWLDLFVTNNNTPNRLYHNERNGTFSLSGTLPSFENGYFYSSSWADFNNDGWIDLFAPSRNNNNSLYLNSNGVGFTKITGDVVSFEGGHSDAGIWADYNNNGKMDLFVGNGSVTPLITNYLYNNITSTGNYITFKLSGCSSNKSAIGAKIKVKAGNVMMIREINGGTSSQSMLWQHFGLGSITSIDSVIIYWTTGNIQKLTNVAVNQIMSISECTIGIISNQIPVKYELKQNYPNPFNPSTQIEYSLLRSENVKINIYDLNGKHIQTMVNEFQSHGTYRVQFDGTNFASGVYFYKIETGDFLALKKMILLK